MELTEALLAELNAVGTTTDFTRCLAQLWVLADRPSYRTLSARAIRNGQTLSKTTVGQVLNGEKFPRKSFLISFLTCCGVAADQHPDWVRAWERLAPMYHGTKQAAPAPRSRPSAAADGPPDGPMVAGGSGRKRSRRPSPCRSR